jgi:hypothetical protein
MYAVHAWEKFGNKDREKELTRTQMNNGRKEKN